MHTSSLIYNSISWTSTVDGPGLRLVLFLQGCLLNCPWCHSPHSIPITTIPILFFPNLCQMHGQCLEACPKGLHSLDGDVHQFNRTECTSCSACVTACSENRESNVAALRSAAVQIEIDELWRKLSPQLMLLRHSGGLTVSGGEPLLQGDRLPKLFDACKSEDINIALETSGFVPDLHLDTLGGRVDIWLFGLRPNGAYSQRVFNRIITNLGQLVERVGSENIIVRTPLVPAVVEHEGWHETLCSTMKQYGLQQIEFLPLNPDTDFYYQAMGKEPPAYPAMMAEIQQDAVNYFEACGFQTSLIAENK